MNYLKVAFGVLIALSASRFIPHPPNFTSLLALSFYVPALLGIRYLPIVLVSFILTDIVIGMHSVTFFTWGSVVLIGLVSKSFLRNLSTRIVGSLLGACIFFIITNFGVWSLGTYGYNINGLINCYILAIPFFTYSLLSTVFFSIIFECILKLYQVSSKILKMSKS